MAIQNAPAAKLIAKTAEELKKNDEINPPEWAMFVKTGHTRERAPTDTDWWYTRAASVLRRVARLGPIGTEKLRSHYGSRKNKGHKPGHHYKAGGNIIRKVLQQLDKAGLTKATEKGTRKGRIVTPQGQSMLYKLSDSITQEAAKEQPKAAPAEKPAAKPTPKEEAKPKAPKQEEKSKEPKAKEQPKVKEPPKAEEQSSST